MVYRHQSFTLNSDGKKAYNRYGDEVRLVGDAFRFLEFLCQQPNNRATVTDIGDYLDRFKDFSDAYFRSLKNKIQTTLNAEFIDYGEGSYSINGEIEQSEKLVENKDIPSTATSDNDNRKKFIIPIIIVIILLGLGIVGYFIFNKTKNNVGKITNDMVEIPAGEFLMGSTEDEIQQAFDLCVDKEGNYCVIDEYYIEYSQHSVYVDAFLIDRKEVSNADYNLFIQATKYPDRDARYKNDVNLNGPLQPVVGVTWDDAYAFCKWAGKRLPLESEWEKAARGTDGRIWPWGSNWDPNKSNHGTGGEPGTDASDGFLYTAPVGATEDISPYGVLNMAGNVFEWIDGDFGPYPGNDKYNHPEYQHSDSKLYRGGSYYTSRADMRTATRGYDSGSNTDVASGFRCAKDI
ncbi:MAG: SUMF1/EgtB/PvdO family nonheme iron enzyme [Patescibacteria group bacterium]